MLKSLTMDFFFIKPDQYSGKSLSYRFFFYLFHVQTYPFIHSFFTQLCTFTRWSSPWTPALSRDIPSSTRSKRKWNVKHPKILFFVYFTISVNFYKTELVRSMLYYLYGYLKLGFFACIFYRSLHTHKHAWCH